VSGRSPFTEHTLIARLKDAKVSINTCLSLLQDSLTTKTAIFPKKSPRYPIAHGSISLAVHTTRYCWTPTVSLPSPRAVGSYFVVLFVCFP